MNNHLIPQTYPYLTTPARFLESLNLRIPASPPVTNPPPTGVKSMYKETPVNLSPTHPKPMPDKPGRAEPQSAAQGGITFEAAFHTYWPRIHALLFRLTGDPDEAEDLATEVFLRLHRAPRLLQPGQNLPAWLHRVAANLGYNALRAARRRHKYETEAGQQHLQNAPPDPAAEAERHAQQTRVRHTLAHMKPRDAHLLLLRHSGLSYAELAAALHLNPNSIGKLLSRAEKDFEKRYPQS